MTRPTEREPITHEAKAWPASTAQADKTAPELMCVPCSRGLRDCDCLDDPDLTPQSAPSRMASDAPAEGAFKRLVTRLRAVADDYIGKVDRAACIETEAADTIESLTARIAALEGDAARYQFLRSRDPGPDGKLPPAGPFIGLVPENLIVTEEDADQAVDAARQSREETGDRT